MTHTEELIQSVEGLSAILGERVNSVLFRGAVASVTDLARPDMSVLPTVSDVLSFFASQGEDTLAELLRPQHVASIDEGGVLRLSPKHFGDKG